MNGGTFVCGCGVGRKDQPHLPRKRRRQSMMPLKHHPQCCDGSCGIDGCNGRCPFIAVDNTEMIKVSNVEKYNQRRYRCRRIPKCAHLMFTLPIFLLLSTASIIFAKPSCLRLPTASFVAQSPSFATRHHIHNNSLFGRRSPKNTKNIASLFVSIQNNPSQLATKTTERGVMKDVRSEIYIGSHNNSDDTDSQNQQPVSLHPIELQSKLSSFSSNINRYRMLKKRLEDTHDVKANDNALIGACNSLYYFLRDETDKLSTSLSSTTTILQWDVTMIESIQTTLESALIQSIRGTSEVGDFVLLNKLVHGAVDYATVISKVSSSTESKSNVAILSPRIFGEAITSLSNISKASLSKVKSLWNFYIYDIIVNNNSSNNDGPGILSSPPSSYELNAMLLALSERKKVSAALKLYRQTIANEEKIGMKGDAYTASILLGMMADSISSGGQGGKDTSLSLAIGKDSPISPCWQWNEAISLLDTFNEPYQLNNYAYAALLKVNECAAMKYSDENNRHNGVKCAMYVLERMKVREYHTY